MLVQKRMERVKGAVLALLADACQKCDQVGVISLRGTRTEVILEPTYSAGLVEKQLQPLSTGVWTPLAHALVVVYNMMQHLCQEEPKQTVLLVVLSDEKVNVQLPDSQGGDAWDQI